MSIKKSKGTSKVKSKSKSKEEVKAKKSKTKETRVERQPKGKKKKRTAKEVTPLTPIKDKMNRGQLLDHLVNETAVDKKDIKKVLLALETTILSSVIYKKGAGEFTMPGMFKIVTKFKPATKGGEKKKNSFKPGEFIITKAKPASVRVKIRPMKKLKEAALPKAKE